MTESFNLSTYAEANQAQQHQSPSTIQTSTGQQYTHMMISVLDRWNGRDFGNHSECIPRGRRGDRRRLCGTRHVQAHDNDNYIIIIIKHEPYYQT